MLLYLDLAHWIGLAKARIGHPAGVRYRPVYEALQHWTASGAVTTPLSAEHYAEIGARIKDLRQRNDIALTMAELSQYASLISRHRQLRFEFRRAVAAALGRPVPAGRAPASVGYGVGHAFGHPFRGRLTGPGSDSVKFDDRVYEVIDEIEMWVGGGWRFGRRHTIQNRRELLIELFNEVAEFVILRGPAPAQIEELRSFGYRPEAAAVIMEDIAEREGKIKESLRAGSDLRRRVDDVVVAATIVYDLLPATLPAVLRELGAPADAFTSLGRDGMARVLAETPILAVEMALRRELLKNGDYVVKVNDTYDVAALGLAVVCCDVVVTDRSAAHRLTVGRLDSRYNCRVISTPEELLVTLDQCRTGWEPVDARGVVDQ